MTNKCLRQFSFYRNLTDHYFTAVLPPAFSNGSARALRVHGVTTALLAARATRAADKFFKWGVNYENEAEFLQGQRSAARPVWKFNVSLCIKDTNRGGQNRTEETKL